MKYDKTVNQKTNSMLVEYLQSNQGAQNILLIYMAVRKWISIHVDKEYLGDILVASIMAMMIIVMFLVVGEAKLRSMM